VDAASSLTVSTRRRQDTVTWWWGYAVCVAATLVTAFITVRTAFQPFSLALLMLTLGVLVALARPAIGIYLMVFFTIVGDTSITSWYPFTKNFSSGESLLYLSDQFIVSPLEVMMVAVVVGWLLQMLTHRSWVLHRGPLFRPLMVFTGFMILGLVYGLAKGGDSNVALWEIRAMLYLPVLYVVFTNLFRQRRDYERMFWCVMIAVFVDGVLAYNYLDELTAADRQSLESLVEHGATLPMNALFTLMLAAWMFKGSSTAKRVFLPLMAVPVVTVYLISERRAAIIGLIASVILLFVVLYWYRRKVFWVIAPIFLVVSVGYLGAFWNSQSSLGAPALAAKSVLAPEQLDEKDQSSDLYRKVENANIVATIRANPLTGVGFGNKFDRPYPLPFITPFLLADYMPHNSILWIWMKAGIGGFVALVYLFGTALRAGGRAVAKTAGTPSMAITLASVGFVLAYLIFAYVDIAWDPQNIVVLALALALIDSVGRLDDADERLADADEADDLALAHTAAH
jgi:O-antigen ligase